MPSQMHRSTVTRLCSTEAQFQAEKKALRGALFLWSMRMALL